VQTDVLDSIGALGDPTRRAIFEIVAARPLPVGMIADLLPVTRPAVSQHLKVLKDAGLVVDRAAGTRRIYQADPDGIAALRAYFDRFWSTALTAFKRVVEQPTVGPSNVEQPEKENS
jgi:DNA-binding transcriptional ArsR family regulator